MNEEMGLAPASREDREVVWVNPETKKLLEKYKGNLSFGKFINLLVQNYIVQKNG